MGDNGNTTGNEKTMPYVRVALTAYLTLYLLCTLVTWGVALFWHATYANADDILKLLLSPGIIGGLVALVGGPKTLETIKTFAGGAKRGQG